MIMALYYDIIILQFIEIVIYFSKLIDICINRYESRKKLYITTSTAPEEKIAKAIFFMYIKRWDSKRNVPSSGWFKARLNAGKNSPVDYFLFKRKNIWYIEFKEEY